MTPHTALLLPGGSFGGMSEPPAACLLETARAWLPLALSAAAAIFLGRFLTRYVKHVKDLIRLLHVDAQLHWLRKNRDHVRTMGDLQNM